MIRTRTLVAGLAVAGLAATGLATAASASPSASPTAPTPPSARLAPKGPAKGAGLLAFYAHTTSDQRVCLAGRGLTAPAGKLTDAQRADVLKSARAAADACGVTLPKNAEPPARFLIGFAKLTAEQQACVAKASLTRPVGRLTDAQRTQLQADVKAAAASCGVN